MSGESLTAVLLGLVEHPADGGDADEPGEAEGAAGHVLSEALDTRLVACSCTRGAQWPALREAPVQGELACAVTL